MGITFEVRPGASFVRTRFVGEVQAADIIQHYKKLVTDPGYRSDLDEWVDGREAIMLMSAEDAQVIGQWFRENRPVRRIAIVMDESFGFARMVQNRVGDEKNFAVFREMEAVPAFLRVSDAF